MRLQVSRGFLFAAFLLLVVSGFLLCFCWQLYLAVAACSVLAFCFGARLQRLVAVALFVVAVVMGVAGYQRESALRLRLKALPVPTATPNKALQRTGRAAGLPLVFDV